MIQKNLNLKVRFLYRFHNIHDFFSLYQISIFYQFKIKSQKYNIQIIPNHILLLSISKYLVNSSHLPHINEFTQIFFLIFRF